VILDVLPTTDVLGGEGLVPTPASEDSQSGVSEWELRERQAEEEGRRREAEETRVEVGEQPSLPTSSFMASAEEE